MIGFAIPTWNRAEKLRRCVDSLAMQNPSSIYIADNGSDDDTPLVGEELVRRYPFVEYQRFDEHVPFSESYKRAIQGAKDEYVWTFGDDDKLVPTSYDFIRNTIKNSTFDFYHVAETTRIDRAEGLCGTTFQLSNSLGFIDLTGFISGNVMNIEKMQAVVNSADWDTYKTSSYPQSLAIMDATAHNPAMMLELGCIDGGIPDDGIGQQWLKEDTCWKYLYIADGLRRLHEKGTLPEKVSETFFRYLEGSLIHRLVDAFNSRIVFAPQAVSPHDWDCLLYIIKMVEGERGDELLKWAENIKTVALEETPVFEIFTKSWARLQAASNGMNMPVYPRAYLPTGEAK